MLPELGGGRSYMSERLDEKLRLHHVLSALGLVLNNQPVEWLMQRKSKALPSNSQDLKNRNRTEVKLKMEKLMLQISHEKFCFLRINSEK